MARVLPRTNFHSSTLLRCLTDLAVMDAADPGNAFAEQLGSWIHFADAIALSAVHKDGMANPSQAAIEAPPDALAAARAEFGRIRSLLAHAITQSCSPRPGKTHIRLPVPEFDLPPDPAAAYVPYRRFYEAHQRDMESSIQPLRSNVREALARTSPRLRKLAALDATLESILRERESRLLAKVPALLKKRFVQLFQEHQRQLAETRQADNPAGWMGTGAWLARFCGDMHMLLLAELELRLQPALGLIEAYQQDKQ